MNTISLIKDWKWKCQVIPMWNKDFLTLFDSLQPLSTGVDKLLSLNKSLEFLSEIAMHEDFFLENR